MAPLHFTTRMEFGSIAHVTLQGDLDFGSFERLREYLLALLELHPEAIRLDLRAVHFLSSVGVWTLMDAQICARAQGTPLTLSALSPQVREVLDILNLRTLLQEATACESHRFRREARSWTQTPRRARAGRS